MSNIGVVIPCKNHAHFMADALESVRGQFNVSLTVIVNDGGDDGLKLDDLACAFPHTHVIHLLESRGIGIARNVGAAFAHTELLFFLDADDYLHRGALEVLATLLKERPSAAFAYGNYTQEGALVETMLWSEGRSLLDTQNIASYCNLWRRGAFWEIGGYSAIPVAEDWDLQKRAYRAGFIAAHADVTVFEHRLHGANKWQADAAEYGGMEGVAEWLKRSEQFV